MGKIGLGRIAALAGLGCLLATSATADPRPRVTVAGGALVGETTDRANIFRNIPFAAPPVGERRWAPPAPPAPWTGDRDATQAGPSCPQPMNADGSPNSGGANGATSEDCLQLNVFAPRGAPKGSKPAPVMVWIHGGGHRTGAGWIYDGQNFARDGVVLVAINYRLGALGYFAHPALTRDAGDAPTGNFGLMDQIAALRWVQDNIAAFGGDPANVTVFGESAGGMSTLALLAAPEARGLFHKAIVQSGLGWFQPSTLTAREQAGAAALSRLGVAETASAADLRALPVDRLVSVGGDYQPFVDGRVLRQTPSQALVRGGFADVPLIIGWNSGEDSLLGPRVPPPVIAQIPAAARTVYAEEAAAGDETLARAIFTDRVFGGPARWVASQASGGQPAWLYHFSYVATRMRPAVTTAAHAAEIPYVFEYWGRRTPMSMVSEEDRAMASRMHACWVSFATTSVPTCGETDWPAYDARTDALMVFGSGSGVARGFRKSRLDAQEALALPTLALD
jgi:para-nitrobenzyl esterase